jgi:RNA polymerase sigma-70 factor (ECF subfamily)
MNICATDNSPDSFLNDLASDLASDSSSDLASPKTSEMEPCESGEWMTDEALVERAQKNDFSALRELFDRHEERLFRLAMRFVRDENDAREILQDVFITAWRKLPGFEGRSKIGSWLYRVTANASLMFLRARSRRPTFKFSNVSSEDIASEAANSNHEFGFSWPPRPDEHLASGELRREIQNAVENLPDMLRQVFLAREIEGHSTLQTARSLGVTEQAIKTRLHRARAVLRQNIGGYLAT